MFWYCSIILFVINGSVGKAVLLSMQLDFVLLIL
jgi:hypothetical protein